MKGTMPHWIAIGILSAVLIGIAVKMIVLGDTTEGSEEDPRTIVLLTKQERAMILGEMRGLLGATQSVVDALARNDLPGVERAAREVGSAAISTMDFKLRAKLPLGFKQLGFGTHRAFDEIADMAAQRRPAAEIQKKLAETMNNCLACHASYQLVAQ